MAKLIDEALMDNSEETPSLTLNEVSKKDLDLIVEYTTHYEFKKLKSDIVQPLVSKDPKVFITDEWEREFIGKLDLDGWSELLMAANYLNVPPIFELCCASIAAHFKGKDFEKVKHEFGLGDVTYTPEDEEKLKV